MSREVLKEALRGLRRQSLRAARKPDRGLLISIGMAEPEEGDEGADEETAEDEDEAKQLRRRR